MGAGGFHGRVRDGIGCRLPAMATRSSNPPGGLGGVDRVLVRVCDVLWRMAVRGIHGVDDCCAWWVAPSAGEDAVGWSRAYRAIRTS